MAPRRIPMQVMYDKQGTQPPVYLAGSFSEPPWVPEEMEYTTDAGGEHSFRKTVLVEEGKDYQYKFRIGTGDWWALNEDVSVATDSAGNRNNLLEVPISEARSSSPHASTDPGVEELGKDLHQTPESLDLDGTQQTVPEMDKRNSAESADSAAPGTSQPSTKEPQEADIPPPQNPSTSEQDMATPKEESKPVDAALKELPTVSHEEQQSATDETAHTTPPNVPELVVEKVDTKPAHGDDFGVDATYGQKEAHEMRAADAEPDQMVVKAEEETLGESEIAAEVADTAATLDQEASTPPIADEEAGRLGLRRLSHTPIPEVARTAAEVADSAAILDRLTPSPPISDEEAGRIGYRRLSSTPITEVANVAAEVADSAAVIDEEGKDESPEYPATPAEDRAPLFQYEAHEVETQAEERAPLFDHERAASVSTPPDPSPSVQEEAIDVNDPTLEQFPADRPSILAHMKSAESRLSEDETIINGVPPSPVVRSRSDADLPSPSPKHTGTDLSSSHVPTPLNSVSFSSTLDPSPSLGCIPEDQAEQDDEEPAIESLPSPTQPLPVSNGRPSERIAKQFELDSTQQSSTTADRAAENGHAGNNTEDVTTKNAASESTPEQSISVEPNHSELNQSLETHHQEITTATDVSATDRVMNGVHKAQAEKQPESSVSPPNETTTSAKTALPGGNADSEQHDIGHGASESSVYPVGGGNDDLRVSQAYVTPQVDGPTTEARAQPEAPVSNTAATRQDMAKSTSSESEGDGDNMKQRNSTASSSDSSSALKPTAPDDENKGGLLRSICNTLFGSCFEGVFSRLCGRRKALLANVALVSFSVAAIAFYISPEQIPRLQAFVKGLAA